MAKIQAVHTPAELKNMAINGAMDFFQRIEGTTTTNSSVTARSDYYADMVVANCQGSTSKSYTLQRSTNVPSLSQSGFNSTYSSLFTMTSALTVAAGDVMQPFNYRMEGLDYERIHSKIVTFGFWVYASIAGTYGFSLTNFAGTRAYVTTFAINGANTWQFVPITVTMDSSGTWAFDNTASLFVSIGAVTGSTSSTSTLNAWQAGQFYTATGVTNWVGTSGATFQIAQLSIVEGPLGFGATGFIRAGKTIQQELTLCQRYYEKSYDQGTNIATGTTTGMRSFVVVASTANNTAWSSSIGLMVPKRSDPTITLYSAGTGASGKINVNGTDQTSAGASIGSTGFSINNTSGGSLGAAGQNGQFHYAAESAL